MCGICGFTGELIQKEQVIKTMANVITHRGPDSEGFYVDENIAMGFRRLSIIDLEQGSQPLYNEDGTLVLTFNGEIYNYKALREELQQQGHFFKTHTDSEVLLHGYEQWGVGMLQKLRGMFGFAIYNKTKKSLFMARDFFGIKPLHYCMVGDAFVYGSEIKSILKHPQFKKQFNYKALDTYLSFQYAVPPDTFFEGVYQLLPAHYLLFENGEITTQRYWEPKFRPNSQITEEQATDMIEKVFEESVEAHKIADVEVGCFLSSGVDSSYVSTYFADQKTFTVGFDFGLKYNEISWAERLSEKIGVEHHTKLIKSEEFWGAVPRIQYQMDQPLADPSCIALYFVSLLASQYVKVVLSGEGADELFGGYTCYNDPRVFKVYQKIVPYFLRKAIANLCKKLPDIKGRDYLIRAAHPLEERFIGNAFMFDEDEKYDLLLKPTIVRRPQDYTKKYYRRARRYDDVTKMQYLDINLWMVGDILLKADRMSMANSLELRVPFLDKEVFRVASQLPTHLRVNKHNTKYAMRKAAMRHLPPETAQKEKLGFPVPTRVWLRDEKYYNVVKERFQSPTCYQFFNKDFLLNLLDEHFEGKEDNSRRIWTVYVFLVWYDIYFADENDVTPPDYPEIMPEDIPETAPDNISDNNDEIDIQNFASFNPDEFTEIQPEDI
ncbi:MAG: asparagine synthase (glutamine-hydrolyzing) [Oscillospiraceae bacterium]|jgi:asparagine synthase (glutamine-hydrolysing)|nr:asparagine synthase (glutamine-hydrolyzing) [Oscillospiraceae bacterium]